MFRLFVKAVIIRTFWNFVIQTCCAWFAQCFPQKTFFKKLCTSTKNRAWSWYLVFAICPDHKTLKYFSRTIIRSIYEILLTLLSGLVIAFASLNIWRANSVKLFYLVMFLLSFFYLSIYLSLAFFTFYYKAPLCYY